MALVAHVLTLVVAVMGFTFCSCRVCDADRNTNGCSTPMGMNAPFKQQFTMACDKHDICYGCVSVVLSYFRARVRFDERVRVGVLRYNMRDVCALVNTLFRNIAKTFIFMLFLRPAVLTSGHYSHKITSCLIITKIMNQYHNINKF